MSEYLSCSGSSEHMDTVGTIQKVSSILCVGEEESDVVRSSLPPNILKQAELLREAPFLFPFVERVRFFNSLIVHNRMHVQGAYQAFLQGRSVKITVHRDRVYEDAFTSLGGDTGEELGHCEGIGDTGEELGHCEGVKDMVRSWGIVRGSETRLRSWDIVRGSETRVRSWGIVRGSETRVRSWGIVRGSKTS